MDTFAKVVFGISVIILLYYYYRQYKSFQEEKKNDTWPPVVYECPDYWVTEKVGDKNVCKNSFNLGKCPSSGEKTIPGGTVSFNKNMYKGNQGDYQKCTWAKSCGVSWDGIDNKCA